MKLLICFAALAPLLAAADPKPAAQAPAPAAKPAARRTAPLLTVPKDAVQTKPGTWIWTDPQGKRWIYRKTPFGLSRFEAPSAEAEAAERRKLLELTHATEIGDSVKFERPGPFGVYTWQRKKTDLDPEEKLIWERSRAQSSAPEKKN